MKINKVAVLAIASVANIKNGACFVIELPVIKQ